MRTEGTLTKTLRIPLPGDAIAAFCGRWGISQFALFGSVLREDFRPDSDVDVLLTFLPNAHHSIADWASMERELTEIFGRPVDLVSREALERGVNWYRRKIIFDSAEVVHVA